MQYRRGDMELTKGRNLIEHEREIMSRPARTWFQTTVEKAAAKSAGLAEHNLKFTEKKPKREFKEDEPKAPKRPLFAGMSRKEKRRKMAAEDDKEEESSKGNSKGSIDASVRSAKKSNRPIKHSQAKPERVAPVKGKKKKVKNGFERELGVNGAKERERAEKPEVLKKKSMKGGSAGKGGAAGSKREGKAGKRS